MFSRKKKQRFEHYLDRLYGYALAMSRDRAIASELIQECVVRILKARNVPRDDAAYCSWLFTIVRNLWRDHLRSVKRQVETETLDDVVENVTPVFFETVVVNELAVRQAFGNLSDDHREILALVDVAGFSYEESAKILKLPKGTVMSRVSRGRAALARLLNENNIVEMRYGGKAKKL